MRNKTLGLVLTSMLILSSFSVMNIRIDEYHFAFEEKTLMGKDTLKCNYVLDYTLFKGCKKLRNELNKYVIKNILNRSVNILLTEAQLKDSISKDWIAFKEEWQGLLKTNPEFPLNYIKKVEIKQAYETGNYVTLYSNVYYATGGEHAIEWMEYAVFDNKNGRRLLRWQELFSDTVAIKKYAEAKMRKEKYVMEGYSLGDGGWFWGKEFYLNNNFAVNPNGILFYYNVYEIADYPEGITQLLLPYNEIKKYLKIKIR